MPAGIDLRRKRVLVTGGSGFLGSHVVEALSGRGCSDVIVPRKADFDLTRQTEVERLFELTRPEVVLHLAAVVGGIGANRENPARFFFENAMMGIQVIDSSYRNHVEKLVVVGTVCAYPKLAPIPFREDDLWLGYPEETNAPYGIAKKALLVQCQAYRTQYGFDAVYLLPVNLYGPRDNFNPADSHVIPALIRRAVESRDDGAEEFVVWGDGSATREFLFVRDAAEAIVLATEKYSGADPVNIGSSSEISIRDLALKICTLTDYRGSLRWDDSKPNGQPRRKLDTSRAYERFGFRSRTSFDDGLRETVKWFLTSRVTS